MTATLVLPIGPEPSNVPSPSEAWKRVMGDKKEPKDWYYVGVRGNSIIAFPNGCSPDDYDALPDHCTRMEFTSATEAAEVMEAIADYRHDDYYRRNPGLTKISRQEAAERCTAIVAKSKLEMVG